MTKRKDDELFWLLVVNGIFTVALLLVDFFAAKWSVMPVWLKVGVVFLHCLTGVYWYKSLKNFSNPNYDYTRKVVAGLTLFTIAVIMFHHSGWLEEKMFQETVEENKTAQTTIEREGQNRVYNQLDTSIITIIPGKATTIADGKITKTDITNFYVLLYMLDGYELGFNHKNILRGENKKFVQYFLNGGQPDGIRFKVKYDNGKPFGDKKCPTCFEVYDVELRGEEL